MKARLFFAMSAEALWPEQLPQGRIIGEENRHFTLAFLGEVEREETVALAETLPKPPFAVGPAGYFDACLQFPHVTAWRAFFGKKQAPLLEYRDLLLNFFHLSDNRPFTPHMTVCRDPKNPRDTSFPKIPVVSSILHLYESLPHSIYRSLWQLPLHPPFKEHSHTADLAFWVFAESLGELYWNACMALATGFPEIIPFCGVEAAPASLDEVIILLNESLSLADLEWGSPFKAVSFHGELQKIGSLISWEMIVDV